MEVTEVAVADGVVEAPKRWFLTLTSPKSIPLADQAADTAATAHIMQNAINQVCSMQCRGTK